jgi:hypothetical protein
VTSSSPYPANIFPMILPSSFYRAPLPNRLRTCKIAKPLRRVGAHDASIMPRCSGGMESAVRGALGLDPQAHAQNSGVANVAEVWLPRDKSRSPPLSLVRQERDFWMRRQGHQDCCQRQRTPAETIKGRTDSGNPGTNGLFEPDGKTPGSAGAPGLEPGTR